MTLSDAFAAAAGAWSGTNGFRLMPADPLATAPATATLSLAAGGSLLTLAYTWSHPEDGAADGLVVTGPTEDGFVALWADSWHQQPAPMSMTGAIDDAGELLVAGSYAGEWGWRIALALDGEGLTLRMDNVVPASIAAAGDAGPYPVMICELRRPAQPDGDRP